MPDEPVESLSPMSAVSPKSAGFGGISGSGSSNLDKSNLAEERATRLAELQEQVGAEQVGFYTDLFKFSNTPALLITCWVI